MAGRNKTFYNLEPIVLQNLDSIPDRDLTHLMYSYGVRGVGNPELHAAFEKKLVEIADRLDYPALFNVLYYLMFRDNANPEIWSKIVENVGDSEEILPLIYYKPFKASGIFLKYHFPEMDLTDY